jgi:serine/threonine protein kinase
MSPEQIAGAVCHDVSDIYSLGVVTYEMLTARRPFPKVTGPAAMMTALLTQTPLPPSLLSAIPAELDRIVMRCLEREPQDRFGSVIELARELDRLVMARNPLHDEITVVRPDWDSNLTIPDGERTWIDHEAGVIPDPAVAPRAVVEPSTRIAPARSIPLHATLPGVAVATDSRNPRDPTRSDGSGSPVAYPIAPPGWQSIPAQPWMPPSSPFGRLGSGSRRQPPAWSYRLLWVAVAILCVTAIVLAVVL